MNITINEFKITTNPDPYGFGLVKDSVPDPYVFGPPGSESVIYRICTDPELDPSINKQKKKKNLVFHMYRSGTGSFHQQAKEEEKP